MKQIYDDECLSHSRVHDWYKHFKGGREDVNDGQQSVNRPFGGLNVRSKCDKLMF